MFRRYLHLPEETAAAFDEEGWFRTGDIGAFSKDGFLRITDRKKDLIVTAAGKNIAPQPIEKHLEESPLIDQVMLHGDKRKFLTALVTLNVPYVEKLLERNGIVCASVQELVDHPKVRELVAAEVARVNEHLASFETIKRFAILAHPFSVESGELTPTLKVRRGFTSKKYAALLDRLYQE